MSRHTNRKVIQKLDGPRRPAVGCCCYGLPLDRAVAYCPVHGKRFSSRGIEKELRVIGREERDVGVW